MLPLSNTNGKMCQLEIIPLTYMSVDLTATLCVAVNVAVLDAHCAPPHGCILTSGMIKCGSHFQRVCLFLELLLLVRFPAFEYDCINAWNLCRLK